ncbi:pyrimidine (deoxy)nucleoside triphosphate pyrophosphohydrolase [Caldimicrobium thiodismutans]|uniref:Pyrimidine (Deoxy)nucleoside triphosphate pyrophosphohydrolase n=1 Tax=Caldimicrobium thiodismutans TaxID=1653476 RepID=A0A0U4N258_9BACT|nr:NUDIX domain-containing protein [Caldimicrobium thiodismutans]BAU23334.1 pyrimidine (deoxy)nucleoside triphosphate pyrophosphohydrolase [Caldimicrobium thiodismutans]
MKPLLKVVAGLICKEGKVFLVKRPKEKRDGGLFEFPGGKVEKGEELKEALKRELFEELGIKVKEVEFIASEREEKGEFTIEINLFLVKEYEGELLLKEAEEGGFYTIEEALNLALCPPDRRLIENLKTLRGN